MTQLKILTAPDPILRKKVKPVSNFDKELLRLTKNMVTTIKKGDMGLSAPQVGESLSVFVARVQKNKPFQVFINPKIIWRSQKLNTEILPKEELFLEGCLSIPRVYALISRPYKITIEWQNLKGEKKKKQFEGTIATVLQHEYDHLKGILFTDRALEQKTKIYEMKKKGLRELVL